MLYIVMQKCLTVNVRQTIVWRTRRLASAEQLAMGAKPRQSQGVGVGLAVDQQQVGLDVAFAVARPIAGKIVVAVSHIQGLIGRQRDQNRLEPTFSK